MPEGSPLEKPGVCLPPPPETGHRGAFFRVALCLQYNVAEGNGADTTGNLPVSQELPGAGVVGCLRQGGSLLTPLRSGWPCALASRSQACLPKQGRWKAVPWSGLVLSLLETGGPEGLCPSPGKA